MRRLMVLVGTVIFVETMFYAVITPLLPHLADEYGLSKAQAGVLAAAYPAGTLAGAIPCGWLAARIGVRRTVVAGLAVLAASSVAFALASTAVTLDAARFAQGIGGAAAWAGGFGWVVGAAPADRRGTTIGTIMGVAVGGVVFGPVLGAAAAAIGTTVVFCAVAAADLALLAWAAATPAPAPAGATRVRALLDAAVHDRRVRTGMWLTTVPGLIFGTVGVLAPLRLDALGVGAAGVAGTFLGAAVLESVTTPLAGRLSDSRGPVGPSLVGLAGGAAALVLLPWPANAWAVAVLVVVNASLVGFLWAPSSALIADGAEAAGIEPGFAYALSNLAWSLGQAVGAAGSARLAQATSDRLPYLLVAAACALTAGRLGRPRSRARRI
jgi:MFS family permease